jgi:hypothetical protein
MQVTTHESSRIHRRALTHEPMNPWPQPRPGVVILKNLHRAVSKGVMGHMRLSSRTGGLGLLLDGPIILQVCLRSKVLGFGV